MRGWTAARPREVTDEFAVPAAVQPADDHLHRRRDRVPRHRRAVPPHARGALLPDARLRPRRRGRRAGDAPARMALARPLRGPLLRPHLAVPDRDERLPRRARAPPEARRARRRALPRRAPGRGGRAARRSRRALRRARGHGARVPHRDPVAPRPPARGPRPARRARLVGRRDRRPAGHVDPRQRTAPCSGRARRSRPSSACARSPPPARASATSCAATSTPGSRRTSPRSWRCCARTRS